MFTIFNSESLWIGRDMKKFSELRDALDQAHIPYHHKTSNRLGQWAGRGTVRGNMGSLGTPTEEMYEYEILVKKADLEQARHLLRSLQ